MMMSYPTEGNKGKYIATFWAIFNLGAVLGSVLPLIVNNAPHMDPDDVSPLTYILYMVVMGLATLLAAFLVRPSSIIRDDGEPVIVAKFAGVKAEFIAILSVFCDWRMLLLIPAFFFSNFSYTYQFNDFNGFNFNIRTRSLNSILFWVAQIIGAIVIGHLLDRLPMKRPKRAMLGLMVITVLFMATWVGALMVQLQHKWQRKTHDSNDNGTDNSLIDYQHGNNYSGPLAIYAMFGFCDAAFAVYCYWLMGALSNKHDELSRYAGFFKSIQSLGSAVAAPLDLAQTPLLAYLITNWILCAFSIAAMFLVCRTITDTTIDYDDNDEVDEGEDDDGEYNDYDYDDDEDYDEEEEKAEEMSEADVRCRKDGGAKSQRMSIHHSSSFDENLSTICATSEGSKTACGSRASEKQSAGWRTGSGIHDYDDKKTPPYPGPGSHDSYMSSSSSNSSPAERRSSSVLSAMSISEQTACPSPAYQHPHQHIRRSASWLSRVPAMVEMEDGAQYVTQSPLHLAVPPTQSSLSIPSISLTMDGASDARAGIGFLTSAHWAGSAPTFVNSQESALAMSSLPLYPLQAQHDPYIYSSWATSPPLQAPALLSTTAPVVQQHEYLAPDLAQQASMGGTSSFGSTRYDEEQDMDSVDTCSLSSMSSGHDSILEMSDMAPSHSPRGPRTRPQ
ncbi:hypothetical protein BGZ98_006997 [Dissophora globulifera]|nr:hypothetical protein BGZ98_006997 [Dissophora globulifera]